MAQNDLEAKIQAEAEALHNVLKSTDELAAVCEEWWSKQVTDKDMADAIESLVLLVAILREKMAKTWLEVKHGKH